MQQLTMTNTQYLYNVTHAAQYVYSISHMYKFPSMHVNFEDVINTATLQFYC